MSEHAHVEAKYVPHDHLEESNEKVDEKGHEWQGERFVLCLEIGDRGQVYG